MSTHPSENASTGNHPPVTPSAQPYQYPSAPPPPGHAPSPGYAAQPPGYGNQHPYAGQLAALQQRGPAVGPIGQVRSTGTCILLTVVTLGIYALVWYFKTHEEMKRHTAEGLGGGVALLIAFVVGVASPFLSSAEVGSMYERRGEAKPVSGVTGLWFFPGFLLLFIGPIVWFVKTNSALNNYWRSLGAQ